MSEVRDPLLCQLWLALHVDDVAAHLRWLRRHPLGEPDPRHGSGRFFAGRGISGEADVVAL